MSQQSPKRADKNLPYAADQGLPFLAGADKAGVSVQQKKITQVGASPFAVDLVAQGLSLMADTSYCVIVSGETAARANVTESTMTKAGFSIAGGANAEVLHVTIIGRLNGQVGPLGT